MNFEHSAEAALESLLLIWNFGLFAVGGRTITVGTIVLAALLFAIGFWVSRRLSRLLSRTLVNRFKVERGIAASIEALSYYFLILVFALWALNITHVPLTAFTVVGGGLAIGVGFGSQNVINNFISGLILILERPIKVGDIIDLEGTYGRVHYIGARSTQIVTFDNIQIIVPNSSFLEKNVVNWTHSDDVVRTHVDVGVAYGSPTREVDRLIRHALKEHGRILDNPAASVLFTDFGDSSLVFRANFWLRVPDMMERRRVESDLRFLIDNLFREAGIEIAFPQRDVHLDFTGTVPVTVSVDENAQAPPAKKSPRLS
jgi:potassium efflux system protein